MTMGLLVVALAALGAGVALLETTIRRTAVGVGLVLVTAAVTVTNLELPETFVGGTRIAIWDAVAVLVFTAALARLLRARKVSGLLWLLSAFGLVALSSAALGVSEHGLNTAVNEFRKYFWFVSVALYVATIEPRREFLDRMCCLWFAFAGFVLALSLVRWALLPFGWEGWAAPVGGGRAVDAAGALVMAQAAVLGLVAWARGKAPRWMRRLTPALLAAVVLMRHRTVWAVLLGTVAVVIIADRRTARRLLPLTAAGLVVVLAVSITVLDQDAAELQEDLAGAATYRDTWEWRVDGWVALIQQSGPRDHPEVLIGRPFGGGWARAMDRGTVEVSPHSFYLETFLRVGVIGVGLLTLLYAIIIWRLAAARRHEGGLMSHASLFLVLVGHPIYFVAYTPHPEQGVLFGLALAAAASLTARGRASEHAREPLIPRREATATADGRQPAR